MGQSFKTNTGKYLKSSQVILESGAYFSKESHEPVTVSWEKMSKSKYNGVNPSEMIEEFGVDTVRLVMLSDVAPTSHRKWSKNSKFFFISFNHERCSYALRHYLILCI